eukprot:TRINITY_DN8578_c0_g1_i1.p1 TRINITY_DN8578_c0_g1~~TRINITY_DN8578_c0_g1_i1.p1  ORF type:complete len:508 (-),score=56.41 TRINITY_DN8578_c0_g1_i1:572-2095(-)
MTSKEGFAALSRDTIDKVLLEHSLSQDDILSLHVACPAVINREIVSAAGVKLYTNRLRLSEKLLSKYVQDEEAMSSRAFVRYLAALEEAQARREGMVSTSTFHTIALRSNGDVAVCGKNDGRLGENGYADNICSPFVLSLGIAERIVKVAAGAKHSLLLTDAGTVYAMGTNKFGECGLPPGTPCLRPTRVDALRGVNIIDIETDGFSWSFRPSSTMGSSDGRIFQCGRGSDGSWLSFDTPIMGIPANARILKLSMCMESLCALVETADGSREVYLRSAGQEGTQGRKRMQRVGGLNVPVAVCATTGFFFILEMGGTIVRLSGTTMSLSLLTHGGWVRTFRNTLRSMIDPSCRAKRGDRRALSGTNSRYTLDEGERVVGISAGKWYNVKDVLFLLGERGSVVSVQLQHQTKLKNLNSAKWTRESKQKPVTKMIRWVLPDLADDDRVLQIEGGRQGNVFFVTKQRRVFSVGPAWVGSLGVGYEGVLEAACKGGYIRHPMEATLLRPLNS